VSQERAATEGGPYPNPVPVGAALCGGPCLVLFALEREAAPFRKLARGLPRVEIHVTGVGRKQASEAAKRLLQDPVPSRVIAAGFCGALIPTLHVGDLVMSPRILTTDHLVSDPIEKRRLAELHGAGAVDMESAAVAEVCAAKGVPFLAVRAVSDAVDTALSPELVRLLSGGRVSVWKALRALVRKPRLLSEFRRLARDTRLAAKNLAEALVEMFSREAESSERSA
jgi:adenosylhomocysteine nucleosidase